MLYRVPLEFWIWVAISSNAALALGMLLKPIDLH